MLEYKNYTGVFEYDPELELLAGHVVDIHGEIYFEGKSVDALKQSMHRAVDHYLGVCKKTGRDPVKPFSGRLNVRMQSGLHRDAVVAASTEGVSLNSWIVGAIKEKAGAL